MLGKEEIFQNLLKVSEFQGVPQEQIKWLLENGTVTAYQDGEKIIKGG